MAIADRFIRVFNFLANMGLVLRDDPPKVIDMTGREWGAAIDGVALSIRTMPRDSPHDPAVLAVVIRNNGTAEKSFTATPGWMFFYHAEVTRQDGSAGSADGIQASRSLEARNARRKRSK